MGGTFGRRELLSFLLTINNRVRHDDFYSTVYESFDWIEVAHNEDQRRALVNAIMGV